MLSDSEGAPETKVKIKEQNQGSRSYFESWGGRGGLTSGSKSGGGEGLKTLFLSNFL